jgi:hypothetical protein
MTIRELIIWCVGFIATIFNWFEDMGCKLLLGPPMCGPPYAGANWLDLTIGQAIFLVAIGFIVWVLNELRGG